MTGQSLFGELKGGVLAHVSTGFARRLLDPSCALLATLGQSVPFEVAVGLNGLVWVAAQQPKHAVAVVSALERAELLDETQSAEVAAAVVRGLA
jgi:exosome complex component RRP40